MPEYIDKDKLLSDIECVDISDCTDIDNIFTEIERTIDDQPTADVAEVKHGEWIKIKNQFFSRSDGKGGNAVKCSVCGEPSSCSFATPFCSICGAKMDKE